jgi:hypothetical protein
MRSPERIEPFLRVFGAFWQQYPHLRFRQIVELIERRHPNNDLFHLEEKDLADFIESIIAIDQKNASKREVV